MALCSVTEGVLSFGDGMPPRFCMFLWFCLAALACGAADTSSVGDAASLSCDIWGFLCLCVDTPAPPSCSCLWENAEAFNVFSPPYSAGGWLLEPLFCFLEGRATAHVCGLPLARRPWSVFLRTFCFLEFSCHLTQECARSEHRVGEVWVQYRVGGTLPSGSSRGSGRTSC